MASDLIRWQADQKRLEWRAVADRHLAAGCCWYYYQEAMRLASIGLRRGSDTLMYDNIEVALYYWMQENCK